LASADTRLEDELSHVMPSLMMRTIKSSQEKGTSSETLSMHRRAAGRDTPCKAVNQNDAGENTWEGALTEGVTMPALRQSEKNLMNRI
jgi:hypothetical protein